MKLANSVRLRLLFLLLCR